MEVSRLMDHGSKCQSHRAAEHVTFFFAKTLSDKDVLCQLKRTLQRVAIFWSGSCAIMTALRVDLASCEISTLRSIENEEQTASVTI